MESLFKSVGKGLLYLLVLPFFLLVISGYAIAGLIAFIYLFFKSIVLFFMGRSLNIELPEDKKAKQIIQNAIPASSNPVIKQDGAPQTEDSINIVEPRTSDFVPLSEPSTVEDACFGIDIESENPKAHSIQKDDQTITIDEPQPSNIKPADEKKTAVKANSIPEESVPIGKYSPKRTHFDDLNDQEDGKEKEKDSGVDIHFKDF